MRENLPPDWINDGAKGFLYSTPPVTLWNSYPGLDVYIPALEYMLAMKIVAGRPQDIEDAQELIRYLNLLEPQAVVDILKRYIPKKYLTVRMQYMIDDWFD